MSAPEGVVPIAQIRIMRAAQDVDKASEHPVTEPAQAGDVAAAAPCSEPGALGEVRAIQEGPDKPRDLRRVGRAVRIDHSDDFAGGRGKPAGEGIAFAGSALLDDPDVGTQPTGGGD